ncbi:MAG: MIP/aquaporin family protein [Janthinobacterium lividum]
MALVLVVLTYNPWGKRSGAHINPAVTLAFWQLGKIQGPDGCWYPLAQAVGGIGAMLLLRSWLFPYYAHPLIHFLTTKPGPGGAGLAFAAEFSISFGLMALLLFALHSATLKKATGWPVGALLGGYIVWESPISGMSLNPFRSLAAVIIADDFTSLWVYLLAPTAAMWLAAVLFQRRYLSGKLKSTQLRPPFPSAAPPHYPVSIPH